jgi:hypothetical protein
MITLPVPVVKSFFGGSGRCTEIPGRLVFCSRKVYFTYDFCR